MDNFRQEAEGKCSLAFREWKKSLKVKEKHGASRIEKQ
jgi:hypothetical protein